MGQTECDRISSIVTRAAGWTFARIFTHYFGESTLVLKDEDSGGGNLELSFTKQWLLDNRVAGLVVNKEEALEMERHVTRCSSPQCQKAKGRLVLVAPFFEKGLPAEIALMSAFMAKWKGERSFAVREHGFGRAIDQLKPVFQWFAEERTLWIWSE